MFLTMTVNWEERPSVSLFKDQPRRASESDGRRVDFLRQASCSLHQQHPHTANWVQLEMSLRACRKQDILHCMRLGLTQSILGFVPGP